MTTTTARVLARYVEAANILPLIVDKARIARWVEGITKKKVLDVNLLGTQGTKAMAIVSFEDGTKVLYEVHFEIHGDNEAVRVTPKVKPVRFVK